MRSLLTALLVTVVANTALAGEFYLRAIDGTGKLGPFRSRAGAKVWIDGTEHLLLGKKRNLKEGDDTEFAIKNPATKEMFGPFVYAQGTQMTVLSNDYTLFISPLTDWEMRYSRQAVMWTWSIEGGTRTRRYGEQKDRVYVVITAKLKKEENQRASSGYYVKSDFKNLLKQLFASNPNEEEISDKLAAARIDGGGAEPFLGAIVPQSEHSWCMWAFVAAETNSNDFLHFDNETYPLPPTFSTDDSITMGEEIWRNVPDRHTHEYINPDRAGISIPPPDSETEFIGEEGSVEPQEIQGGSDSRAISAYEAEAQERAARERRRRQAEDDRRKLNRKKLQKYSEPSPEDVEDKKASILSGETGLKRWKIKKKEDREYDSRMPVVW